MYAGYLNKRNAPISPPSMQKVYSVLWGTLLLDFENEEEAKSSMNPKLAVEVVGVSEWDGKGRANNYPYGFLIVTHTRANYYVSVQTIQERTEWILQIKRGLECGFANNEVSPFSPLKIIQTRISPLGNPLCPKTHNPTSSYSPICKSCGKSFYSAEYVNESTLLLHYGSEELEKVCLDCRNSQLIIYWLKSLNYVHTMDIHEHTPYVLRDVHKYKESFTLRRRISQRLDMAAELFEQGNLTAEEFEELRQVDHAYRREVTHDECQKLKVAIETFGEDIQTIINILMDSNMTKSGGRNACFKLIIRILEIADKAPDLVDFYFPQLYQVHLQQLLIRDCDSLMKIDCIQQVLLVLAQKYPAFALKLAYNLLASSGDFEEKKITQIQYAGCMALLMQLEMVVSGEISCLADKPNCQLLTRILKPSTSQQQEIGYEISVLFLIRRKLQEIYDNEEEERIQRNILLYGENHPSANQVKQSGLVIQFPGANFQCTGLELLYQLGVGQAKKEEDPEENGSGKLNSQQSDSFSSNHIFDGFHEQIDFITRLNDLVDSLRFIDRANRTDVLRKELSKWNKYSEHVLYRRSIDHLGSPSRVLTPVSSHGKLNELVTANGAMSDNSEHSTTSHTNSSSNPIGPNGKLNKKKVFPLLGWDPNMISGEPAYRIVRIITEECRVFRTKARAPSLIVCEVVRNDMFAEHLFHHFHIPINHFLNSYTKEDENTPRLSLEHPIPLNLDNIHADERELEGSRRMSFSHNPVVKTVHHSLMSAVESVEEENQNLFHEKFETISKNLKNVELLIETSLSPTINDLHKQSLEQSKTAEIQQIPSSVSPKLNSQIVMKRRGTAKLSENRISTVSTEGILKSSSAPNLDKILPVTNNIVTNSTDSAKISVEEDEASTSPKQIPSNNPSLKVPTVSASKDTNDEAAAKAITPQVLNSAQKLLYEGVIDQKEYEQLLLSDQMYHEESQREEHHITKSRIEHVLGESFAQKKERILGDKLFQLIPESITHPKSIENELNEQKANIHADFWPAYDLRAFIVKTNDDLRQEICCLQLMNICKEIFEHFGLQNMLFLQPYRIISTNSNCGIVEVIPDTISLDALKKTPGFVSLNQYFKKTYDTSPDQLLRAKHNFMTSLAAYSLFTYILQIKDRHNGNLLIDRDGHILHIDFGFLLSIAPGGSFSVETAPFKLTEEMVELLGGLDSPLFGHFVTAFTKGFIALQSNCENIMNAITILSYNSTFPCFQNKSIPSILEKLKNRFRSELNVNDAVKHCLDLITNSYGHYGTRQYDTFQYFTNGIMP